MPRPIPQLRHRSWAPVLTCGALVLTCGALVPACGDTPAPSPTTRVLPPARTADPAEAPPVAAAADTSAAPPVRKDGTIYAESLLMGTRFSINLWLDPTSPRDAEAAGAAIREAFAEIDRLESLASEWIAESELSRFNAAAGGPKVPLSPDLFALLRRSVTIAEATGGAFDPTFLAVGELWSFSPGATPPDRATIAARLPLVDWRGIELDPSSRRGRLRDPGMKVGLGAIAKGYAVDRAADLLKSRGFHHQIVEGGGDTLVSGSKGDRPWMVGIQRPDGPGTVGALALKDQALVTSGGYQRYFEHEGTRYAHILDPRTGWPLDAAESPVSVSVVADDATEGDAYCTAVTVMGATQGMAFVEAQPALEAVIITQSGELLLSSGLRERFLATPSEAPPAP